MYEKRKARAGVLLGNFFFGTIIIPVKYISPALIHPLALTSVRITVAAFLFWLLYALQPVKTGITKRDYPLLFFCALCGIVINQTFSIRGMSLTSPIHASLLVLATPIAITLLAAWFLKERLTMFKLLGLMLGISGGALLIFSRDISTRAGDDPMLGDVFVVLGALGYSVYVITVKPLMNKYKATHILQWIFLFGACVSLPLGWKDLVQVEWNRFDAIAWFSIVYIVFGATFIAYQLMNYGINKLGAAVTGSYIYTQPVFATMASMILLHESLNFSKTMAALLIGLGVFLTNLKKNSAKTHS